MKINSQNTSQAYPAPSNSRALEIRQPTNSKEQLDTAPWKLADDIYHKHELQEPAPTYSKSITITSTNIFSTPEIEQKALNNIRAATVNLYMPGGEVPKSIENMFSRYDAIMADIAAEQPTLANGDWGIAINESGELEITGTLSDDEKSFIAEKFDTDIAFASAAKDFKSGFLKYLAMDAGGWSKYEVNESNFLTIIDLKELLDNSQGAEDFKQAWGKDFSWLESNKNISSQLERNAVKK